MVSDTARHETVTSLYDSRCVNMPTTHTSFILPADNVDSCSAEIRNVTDWAQINNLKLNSAKSQEIISVDKRRKANGCSTRFYTLHFTFWNN